MAIGHLGDPRSWQQAGKLLAIVSRLTGGDAFRGNPGLAWELQEAAAAALDRIAEARSRPSAAERRQLLDSARRSCKDVQDHLLVALDQACLAPGEFEAAYHQAETVARIIARAVDTLLRQLARRSHDGPGPPGRE